MKYKEENGMLVGQPEMKEPDKWDAPGFGFPGNEEYIIRKRIYHEHLLSLPHYLISGDKKVFQGRLVDESEFKIGKVYLARGSKYKLEGDNNLYDALKDEDGKYYYPVAIPLPVEEDKVVGKLKIVGDDMSCPVTKKHCDHKCWHFEDAECRLS